MTDEISRPFGPLQVLKSDSYWKLAEILNSQGSCCLQLNHLPDNSVCGLTDADNKTSKFKDVACQRDTNVNHTDANLKHIQVLTVFLPIYNGTHAFKGAV